MKPEECARVRSLYDQVIDLPPSERLTRLRELCADASTIREVIALITAAETDTFAHISKLTKSIEGWYNTTSLHSSFGCQSPTQFECAYEAKLIAATNDDISTVSNQHSQTARLNKRAA